MVITLRAVIAAIVLAGLAAITACGGSSPSPQASGPAAPRPPAAPASIPTTATDGQGNSQDGYTWMLPSTACPQVATARSQAGRGDVVGADDTITHMLDTDANMQPADSYRQLFDVRLIHWLTGTSIDRANPWPVLDSLRDQCLAFGDESVGTRVGS